MFIALINAHWGGHARVTTEFRGKDLRYSYTIPAGILPRVK